MTYSIDFRKKVLRVKEEHKLTIEEVAERFQIGEASVSRWIKRLHPRENLHQRKGKIDLNALLQDVNEHPDDYQRERAIRFGVSQSAVCQAFEKLKITYKKNQKSCKSRFQSKRSVQREKRSS